MPGIESYLPVSDSYTESLDCRSLATLLPLISLILDRYTTLHFRFCISINKKYAKTWLFQVNRDETPPFQGNRFYLRSSQREPTLETDPKCYLSHPLHDLCHMTMHHLPIPNLEGKWAHGVMPLYLHSLKTIDKQINEVIVWNNMQRWETDTIWNSHVNPAIILDIKS